MSSHEFEFDTFDIGHGADVGEIIGYVSGKPIRLIGGGAADNFDEWIPEEFDSKVIQKIKQVSAVEALASRNPMKTETKSVPRSGGVDVESIAKSGTYGEDAGTNDAILLTARKLGKAIRIAEEDIDDSLANIVETKMSDWATGYAKLFDNATLAVTAAPSGSPVGSNWPVPFASIYYTLTQNETETNYTANSNITLAGTGGVTYAKLSVSLGQVEQGDYFDMGEAAVIAHPAFRDVLRNIVDDQHRPIFVQGTAGTPDTLFSIPISWSLGAKTSATALSKPTGNPIMVFCASRQYLQVGDRSGPESVFIDGRNGLSALTDESILKMRARRGFGCGAASAFSILVKN